LEESVEQQALRTMKESIELLSNTLTELSGPVALLGEAVVRRGTEPAPPKSSE